MKQMCRKPWVVSLPGNSKSRFIRIPYCKCNGNGTTQFIHQCHPHRWYGCVITVFCLHFTEGKQAESARADAAEKAMKEQMEQRQKLEKAGAHNFGCSRWLWSGGECFAEYKHRRHVGVFIIFAFLFFYYVSRYIIFTIMWSFCYLLVACTTLYNYIPCVQDIIPVTVVFES